jgi:restriction system protein
MARRYQKKDDPVEELVKGSFLFVLLLVCADIFLWSVDRARFWRWLIYEIIAVIAIIAVIGAVLWLSATLKRRRVDRIFETVKDAGLEETVKNFITRFGIGDKSKNTWKYRDYAISWDRINDLQKDLATTKHIDLSLSDINILLRRYIDDREFAVTVNSVATAKQNSFRELNGSSFESLLYRLYEAMGYTVQHTGKTGDQGGDLVLTKGEERKLIQAKCYRDISVGNDAVQQAFAAKSHYDCNSATVVTTSYFTREAIELAKSTGVELIPKQTLQKMLLDYLKESWS